MGLAKAYEMTLYRTVVYFDLRLESPFERFTPILDQLALNLKTK